MSLSQWPDYQLIQEANGLENETRNWSVYDPLLDIDLIDRELDLRKPDIAAWYFGDCAGQLIFIPSEPEYDSESQPIFQEMLGYSNEGEEAWSLIHSH